MLGSASGMPQAHAARFAPAAEFARMLPPELRRIGSSAQPHSCFKTIYYKPSRTIRRF